MGGFEGVSGRLRIAIPFALGSILALPPPPRREEGWRTNVAEDLERLSPRHHEVLALIAEGQSNKEIAILLNISQHTVKGYVEDILLVLGVPNRAGAGAIWATAQAQHDSNRFDNPPPSSPSTK